MRTINENIKYPEFKEQSSRATWFTGHLCKVGDLYYCHSKRVLVELSFDELSEYQLAAVETYNKKKEEENVAIEEMKRNLRAYAALVEWAQKNHYLMSRSNQSESEYYFIHHTDGNTWQVRVSGHRYPTGSMTDLMLHKIDSTDTCCARYCDMLGIEY